MTKIDNRTKGAALDAMTASAKEAETFEGQHEMEEAVLATLAKVGPDDPFRFAFMEAYESRHLDFSRHDLRDIACALSEIVCHKGRPADKALIHDALKKAGADAPEGILNPILAGSKAKDPRVAEGYIERLSAENLKVKACQAIEQCSKEVDELKTDEGMEAIVGGLLKKILAITTEKRLVREPKPESEDARGFVDALAERRTDGRKWLGLDSGFDHLNEVLNGLTTGLHVLAGAPGSGKTTLAKQIADTVAATEKVPVLFWSFEQSKEELRIKSLARLGQVDSRKIWKGRTDADTWKKVEQADDKYRQGPGPWLTIIEAGLADTIDSIRARALMAKHKAGDKPILLVLDYLQIIPAGKDAPDTIRERVDYVVSELRRLARDLNSPVLVISSQNRDAYRGNKIPTLAAMKESGGIEFSGDCVICLRVNSEKSQTGNDSKTMRVDAHILKNRNGELAKVPFQFKRAWARFEEYGKAEPLEYEKALGVEE